MKLGETHRRLVYDVAPVFRERLDSKRRVFVFLSRIYGLKLVHQFRQASLATFTRCQRLMISSQIGELEEKVRNMLMLKFGRLVDLEKLETVTVNRTVEELKEKLRQQESKSAAEIAKWNVSNTVTRIESILVFVSV